MSFVILQASHTSFFFVLPFEATQNSQIPSPPKSKQTHFQDSIFSRDLHSVSVIGMEGSVIGRSVQVGIGRVNGVGFCSLKRCVLGQNQSYVWPSRSSIDALSSLGPSAEIRAAVSEKASRVSRTQPINGVKLFVGLPLDAVSNTNTVNHCRAIEAGLKALKLLGVAGVELPLWWGIAENEAMGKYNWTGYLAIVQMVQRLDLEINVSLCFHASKEHGISLPQWVSEIGESDPSIYFADKSGKHYRDCLSLAVDELPVLDGNTPIEVYRCFFENFKSTFSPFFGSTITGLTIGLGPDGELRYPSHHHQVQTLPTTGEFQCYDKNMLANLKLHSEKLNEPLWGLGGPHDAPSGPNHSPTSGGFFADNGGYWETPYGNFFLTWYSSQLISHGDRVLSLAASTFENSLVMLSAQIPLMDSWYKTRSHPSELTAGIYNTDNRDGYELVLEMFLRNSCRVVLTGFDLSDEGHSIESPESLLAQVMSCCRKHEVEVSGQNTVSSGRKGLVVSSGRKGLEKIKENLVSGRGEVCSFTYQRMGAHFFSPEHFSSFTRFVRGLNELLADLPNEGELVTISESRMYTESV